MLTSRVQVPFNLLFVYFEIVVFDDVQVTHPADERVGSIVYMKERNYIISIFIVVVFR